MITRRLQSLWVSPESKTRSIRAVRPTIDHSIAFNAHRHCLRYNSSSTDARENPKSTDDRPQRKSALSPGFVNFIYRIAGAERASDVEENQGSKPYSPLSSEAKSGHKDNGSVTPGSMPAGILQESETTEHPVPKPDSRFSIDVKSEQEDHGSASPGSDLSEIMQAVTPRSKRTKPDYRFFDMEGEQEDNRSYKPVSRAREQSETPMEPANPKSPSKTSRTLPVPTKLDSLELTMRRVEALSEVVRQRDSIALRTGRWLAPDLTRDALIAKEIMTQLEYETFIAWREQIYNTRHGISASAHQARNGDDIGHRFVLPEFKWDEFVAPLAQKKTESARKLNLAIFTSHAAAMDIVFGHHGATPENAAWLEANMPQIWTLVTAVNKITKLDVAFRVHALPHMQGLNNIEAVELQTMHRIVARADITIKEEMSKLQSKVERLNRSLAIIRTRIDDLESKERDASI
ncbi:hypothetical protein BJX76DRAFT_167766 [Aspergillus varians]